MSIMPPIKKLNPDERRLLELENMLSTTRHQSDLENTALFARPSSSMFRASVSPYPPTNGQFPFEHSPYDTMDMPSAFQRRSRYNESAALAEQRYRQQELSHRLSHLEHLSALRQQHEVDTFFPGWPDESLQPFHPTMHMASRPIPPSTFSSLEASRKLSRSYHFEENQFPGNNMMAEMNPPLSNTESIGNDSARVPNAKGETSKSFVQVWDDMFLRLQRYKEEHGDTMVAWNYNKDPKLGSWVSKQRHYYLTGSLTDDRAKRLEELGFVWDAGKRTWDDMYGRLKKYKEENGDCLVPTHYKKDPKLGRWVYVQRNKKGKVSKEQEERLRSIGFKWSVHKAFWGADK